MSKSSPAENIVRIARLHQRTFENAGSNLPLDRYVGFTGWLVNNVEYVPTFSTRMKAAIEWTDKNPEKFETMLADFDTALQFLNNSKVEVDSNLFPNIAAYRKYKKGMLPQIGGQDQHNAGQILAAAKDSGRKLFYGETYRPEDADRYSYHNFVKSDRGMVAASMADLYENYTHEIGLYPEGTDIDGFLANAITEATYLTNPEGELFQAFKNPNDEWIKGYYGFSPQFQLALYGQPAE